VDTLVDQLNEAGRFFSLEIINVVSLWHLVYWEWPEHPHEMMIDRASRAQ
jgi:hypothetical protein